MMIKKSFVIAMLLLLFVTGCTNNQNIAEPDGDLTVEPKNHVTKEEFIDAVRSISSLNDNKVVQESLDMGKFQINQLLIDDEETPKNVVWANNIGYSGVFLVFDKTEGSVNPIFTQVIDERIHSVKWISKDFMDNDLLEVVTYKGQGSNSSEWIRLYLINNNNIETIWENQKSSINYNFDKESQINEYSFSYTGVTYLPSFQSIYQFPTITVTENNQFFIENSSNKELVKQNFVERVFIWDKEKREFVEI